MASVQARVAEALAWLERRGTKKNREGMARFGIVSRKAFGVSMTTMAPLAKRWRRDHALALALWRTGWLEARMLAALVDDPAQVTTAQMEQWCRDFDNWAVCDTVCGTLFDRSPRARGRIRPWSRRRGEYEKRAAFALIAAIARHDKQAPDATFLALLPIVERAADDERNFVKKGVSWALRGIGHRNPTLHAAATDLASRLARSDDRTRRWIGKDVLRDLRRAAVLRRFKAAATS